LFLTVSTYAKLNKRTYSIDWSRNISFLLALVAYKGVAEVIVGMVGDPKDNAFPTARESQEFEDEFVDHRMKLDDLRIRADVKGDLMKNDSTVRKVRQEKIVREFERAARRVIVDEVEMDE
jgi:hypothetical protein